MKKINYLLGKKEIHPTGTPPRYIYPISPRIAPHAPTLFIFINTLVKMFVKMFVKKQLA
jgi:hypothetical protein